MLARRHRFHGHTSLSFVYRKGSTVRSPHIALRFIHNERQQEYRVAVIVGRKVHKSAVARNRVRRRIYEIVRTGPAITRPYDLVITVFSDQVISLPPAELTRTIRGLLAKAGVYRNAAPRSSMQAHGIVKRREDGR